MRVKNTPANESRNDKNPRTKKNEPKRKKDGIDTDLSLRETENQSSTKVAKQSKLTFYFKLYLLH